MPANDSTRRDPRLLLALGATLLACCAAAAVTEKLNPIAPRHFVVWRTPDEARGIALEKKRPILFAFVKERDLESSRFEHELFGNPERAAQINRDFVPVRVVDVTNTGRRNPQFVTALRSQFGAGAPALAVTDPDGARHEVLPRHRGTAQTMAFLDRAARELRNAAPPRDEHARAYVEALSEIGRATAPTFSPDGREIAFVCDLTGQPQLWKMEATGGFPQLVVSMDDGVHAAQWSPGGEWIAFASGAKTSQIYVIRPDGSGLRRLTSGTGRNLMGYWTRDGKLPVSSSHRTTPGMESTLVDPATGASRLVAKSAQFGVLVDVSCDGRRGILIRRDGARVTTLLAGIDPPTAPRELIAHVPGEQTVGSFDCAGRGLLASTNVNRDRTAFARVHEDGTLDVLWERDDAELTTAAVSNDGTRAALVWNRAGSEELALFDLRSGARTFVPLPLSVIGAPQFSRDGKQLIFAGSDAQKPADVWLLDVTTKHVRQLTRSAHPGVDLAKLVRPDLARYRAPDGLELTGWLYRAAKPGAAVISLHGGPNLQETAAMNTVYQALLARGISVFAPNYRGSLGFGRRFQSLDDGARREQVLGDVQAAAQFLIASGVASQKRIGIMGESYGGWLTLAATARHPELFAAAVDEYGMSDLRKMIDEATPEVARMLEAEYGDDELLERFTPDTDAIRTPTLVLHGAADGIVSPSHSNRVVGSLRKNQVPVDYILFPDEGHGWRKQSNKVRATVAITEWFARWL